MAVVRDEGVPIVLNAQLLLVTQDAGAGANRPLPVDLAVAHQLRACLRIDECADHIAITGNHARVGQAVLAAVEPTNDEFGPNKEKRVRSTETKQRYAGIL